MSTKQEHLEFIASKGKFFVDGGIIPYSEDELQVLEKYGHWFQALTSGELEPCTDGQKQFILVATGQKSPITLPEWAWFRYLSRKAILAKSGDAMKTQYVLEEDTFDNREMSKKIRRMNYGESQKNHFK